MQLQALAGEPLLQIGRPPLRHADLGDDVVAAHVGGEQLVDEGLADLDLGGELGELELRVLERGDRLAEGARAPSRSRCVSSSERRHDAIEPTAMQSRSCCSFSISILKPCPSCAEQVRRPGRGSPRRTSSLVSCPRKPELVELAAAHEAGRVGLDEDQADAAVRRLGVGVGLGDDDERGRRSDRSR